MAPRRYYRKGAGWTEEQRKEPRREETKKMHPIINSVASGVITAAIVAGGTLLATSEARSRDIENLKSAVTQTQSQSQENHTTVRQHDQAIQTINSQLTEIKSTQETVRKENREDMAALAKKLDGISVAVNRSR